MIPMTVLRHRGRPRGKAPEAFDLQRNGWKPGLPARRQRSNRTALPTTDYPTTPTRNRNVYRRIEGLQANVVRPQLPHEFKTRQIIIQSGANVWPHEMKTAEALAAAGRTVEFIRRSEEQRTTSADAIIDGIVWEMKAPKASNLKAIEKNLRKALDQSNCVILDSRRMKGIPDHAIERELQACAAGRIKNLKRLLFVNRKAQVIDIK